MNRFGLVDRLQTIAATATVTSAVWIVVGTVYLDRSDALAPAAQPTTMDEVKTARVDLPPSDQLLIPVAGVAPDDLTNSFAETRGGRRHEAIDIMAPAGTPVIAAAPGTVEKLFHSDAGGNTLYVRSGDRRTIYYYAHLQGYAIGLSEGQVVRRGQALGTVGSTGNADRAAPHLHFAVLRTEPGASWYETAVAIDPYLLLASQ